MISLRRDARQAVEGGECARGCVLKVRTAANQSKGGLKRQCLVSSVMCAEKKKRLLQIGKKKRMSSGEKGMMVRNPHRPNFEWGHQEERTEERKTFLS